MMKQKKIIIINDFLATLLNYIPAAMFIIAVYSGVLKDTPNMWKLLLLAIVPFLYYLVRKYCYFFPLFLLLHLFTLGACILFGNNLAEKIIYGMIGGIFFVVSFAIKLKKEQPEDIPLFASMAVVVLLLSYFFQAAGGGPDQSMALVQYMLFYIGIYLLHHYLTGYLAYIKNNEVSTENIPQKRILASGGSIVAGYTFLSVAVCALIGSGNYLSDFTHWLKDMFRRFMMWLLSFAPDGMEQAKQVTEETAGDVQYDIMEQMPPGDMNPILAEIIDKIVIIVTVLIVLAAVGAVTYLLVSAIQNAFQMKKENNEEIEIISPKEKKERIRRVKNTKTKEKGRNLSKDRKIRRLYETTIKAAVNRQAATEEAAEKIRKSLKYQTAEEQVKSQFDDKEEAETFRELYEWARYSNVAVTTGQVKQMKEICEKLKKQEK